MNINSTDTTTHGRVRLTVREMAIFSMLGALMFTSKIVMELLPNVHLLGVLTIVYTLRIKESFRNCFGGTPYFFLKARMK